MTVISLRIPESLHEKIEEVARKGNVSIDQFIAAAAAEKMAALTTRDYLEARAARAGTREEFLALLAQAPDVEPDEHDQL